MPTALRRSLARALAISLSTLLAAASTAQTAGTPCPNPPPCGSNCSNQPVRPTECWTTPYGPARADVILKPSNFLYCNDNTYALCAFSGPPVPTGDSAYNRALPCVLQGSIARCTCQLYTAGANFVDINAILNQGAYFQTVAACGQDGSGCANITNCGPDGKSPKCGDLPQAPVCQYIKNQSPGNPSGSLFPKADLISTFSFAMSNPVCGTYTQGSKDCGEGLYAGCMTAPCHRRNTGKPPANGDPVDCDCPVYKGAFQIGQANQACSIPRGSGGKTYVWSASLTVTGGASR